MAYRAFRRNLTASLFAPFIIALLSLAAVVLWQIQDQASATHWVEHSDDVMLRAKDAELNVREMQVAFRSYLVSPDQHYLADLAKLRRALTKNVSELTTLVSDNQDQEQILVKVTEAKEAWVEAVERLLARKDGGQTGPDVVAETSLRRRRCSTCAGRVHGRRASSFVSNAPPHQKNFLPFAVFAGSPAVDSGDDRPQLLGMASNRSRDRVVQ